MAAGLSVTESQGFRDFVLQFPQSFYEDTLSTWILYKVGRRHNLFNPVQCKEIQATFWKFPAVWEVIEPNFQGRRYDALRSDVNTFIAELNSFDWLPEVVNRDRGFEDVAISGLGVAPLIILGVVAAGALGIGGAIYSYGYVKEQAAREEMVRAVVEGRLPASVLEAEFEAESHSLLGQVTSMVKVAAAVVGLWLVSSLIGKWK